MTQLSTFNQFGTKSEQFSQFAHRFHRDQTCFDLSSISDTSYITFDLIMPELVFLVTVQEAHKEYNTLIDQIQAKYELLDSGE